MQPLSGIGREKVYVPGQLVICRSAEKVSLRQVGPRGNLARTKFAPAFSLFAADFHDARGLPALPDAGREAAGGARPRPVQEDRRRQVPNMPQSIH